MYIWQQHAWPALTFDAETLLGPLAAVRHRQGLLLGRMAKLGFALQGAAQLQAVTEEVLQSSDIEGETLDREQVRSSVARRLGIPHAGLKEPDLRTEGVVEMMLDATTRFDASLTLERLFGWHASLFPTGFSGRHRLDVGKLRDGREGPMQVVSGRIGKERVHYEAPPARRLRAEMKQFLTWFNGRALVDGLLRAGLAHVWLVTIHPFDDGNGRIARAVADMALAQLEGDGRRFYSMSSQIRVERKAYYDVLERTQKGSLDVTRWMSWFVDCFGRAIDAADLLFTEVLARAELAQRVQAAPLNERQRTIMGQLLAGLDGPLTARRWAALGKCSADTAQRDIKELVELELLAKNPGGSKNTSYALELHPR
jgi:Fic family protein